MDSADRSGSDRDAATDGSESGPTAEDSGGEDDVFSDLEYSRVIPTPASQRAGRARTRSTPKTPRRGARDSNNETPVAARQPTYSQLLDAAYYNGNADGNGDSAPETQTQKVLPVTATQLQELGLGFAGTPASPHIPDTSLPSQELGVEPDDATARSRGATPDADEQEEKAEAEAAEALPGLIESDDERVSSGSEELGTPRVAQLGTASYGSGGVVDETPLRYEPFSVPPHVYVLCLWQRKWYPARAERADYEAAQLGPRVASVTFADATTARTDLSQATEFDLQVGDRVQVEADAYKGKKFEVVHLIADDSVTGRIRTTSGHSAARLRVLTPAKTSASAALVVVEVGDVSLTRSDHERWLAARRRMRERESQASPTDGRLARLARRKRPRSAEDAAQPVATVPTSRPTSRRRKIAGSREASLPLLAAPPAAAAGPQRIFSNCVFSISMSDQADDESEEIKQLILSHGGTVLDNGLSDAVRLTDATQSGDMPGHELQFADAAFAAVLAEKPRRTIKYLEMLAVGWPCLMSGFVKECIEQGQFIDWVPWTLPAGVSSVRRKSGAVVNANISQFLHGWLRGEKLATQFVKRHVILKCTVPICVVVGHDRGGPHAADAQRLDAQRLFLASLCAPQYKLWVYMNRDDVPAGSLLLLLGEKKGLKSLATEPHTLHQMKNLASADDVIVKDASWLLECIINGELI